MCSPQVAPSGSEHTLSQESFQNRLLNALPAPSFARLEPLLERLDLPRGLLVTEADTPIKWILFPESGLVSVVNRSFRGRQLEIGVFGWEGMGSTALVLGSDRTPHAVFMQVPGAGHRLPAQAFQAALAEDAELRAVMLLYVQAFMVQLAQTALSNGTCTIEQRLARWLLMVRDRSATDELALTHEFLAIMLGVRRTGVTLAIHMLEGANLIRARRGVVTIVDRARLQETATDGYGPAEAEYERLLGRTINPNPP